MLKFFSAAAFEQRARDRRRKILVSELVELDDLVRHAKRREPVLLAELNLLNCQDSRAVLTETTEAARTALAKARAAIEESDGAVGHAAPLLGAGAVQTGDPVPNPFAASGCPCDPAGVDGFPCPDPTTGKLGCESAPQLAAALDWRPLKVGHCERRPGTIEEPAIARYPLTAKGGQP